MVEPRGIEPLTSAVPWVIILPRTTGGTLVQSLEIVSRAYPMLTRPINAGISWRRKLLE